MDSEDDDLKRAIALSLQDTGVSTTEHASHKVDYSSNNDNATSPVMTMGIPGLDRAAMERERLARIAKKNGNGNGNGKRERSISPPLLERAAKVAKQASIYVPAPSVSEVPAQVKQMSQIKDKQSAEPSQNMGSARYPQGRLFRTWAFGHERIPGKDIKIEEVLERHSVKTAVVSSFVIDHAWLFSKLDTKTTNIQLILHAMGGGVRAALKKDLESLGPNLRVCLPPMDGAFCMHSKLMLLFHADRLRVVVPSANVVSYDWGESGIMENTVWLIDLPRLAPQTGSTPKFTETAFLLELEYFLRKQNLPSQIIAGLRNFDWWETFRYAFVTSIGGQTLVQDEVQRSGLTGLCAAVQSLGLTTKHAQVDMCSSSVGSLKVGFLSNLYSACQGNMPLSTAQHASMESPDRSKALINDNFRLYFPTDDYVANSTGGIQSGGTIWFDRSYWEGGKFPKRIMRQFIGTRKGMLSHCKLIFVRGVSTPPPPAIPSATGLFSKKKDPAKKTATRPAQSPRQVAWLYSGSSNCSESAWGTAGIVKKAGAQKGQAKIYCRNWECGVIIPIDLAGVQEEEEEDEGKEGQEKEVGEDKEEEKDRDPEETGLEDEGEAETESEDEGRHKATDGQAGGSNEAATTLMAHMQIQTPGWNVFADTINSPFEYPAAAYGDSTPWYVKEHMGGRATGGNSAEAG